VIKTWQQRHQEGVGIAPIQCQLEEIDKLRARVTNLETNLMSLRDIVDSNAYASSFQSMGKYRAQLVNRIKDALK